MGLLIVSSPSINQKTRGRNLFYVIIREYCVARDAWERYKRVKNQLTSVSSGGAIISFHNLIGLHQAPPVGARKA